MSPPVDRHVFAWMQSHGPSSPSPSSRISVTHEGGEASHSQVNKLQRAVYKTKLILYICKEGKGHLITGGVTAYSEVQRVGIDDV